MKQLFLFFILALPALAAQQSPKYPKGARVYAVDNRSEECAFAFSSLNLDGELALALSGSSNVEIRVEPDVYLFTEKVQSVRGLLISPRNEVLDLGIATPRSKTYWSESFWGEKVKSLGRTAYFLSVPGERNRELRDLKTWSLQVQVITKKSTYTERLRIHFFDSDQTVLAFYPQNQCSFTTPAHLASELYENPDHKKEKAVDYSSRVQTENEFISGQVAGLVDVSWYSSPQDIVKSGSTSVSLGGQFVSESEKSKRLEQGLEIDLHFTMSPLSTGYVVRQDTVLMTKVQELRFNSCGLLDGQEADIRWYRQVKPAFTFLSVLNSEINNLSVIQAKLNKFKMFNTCTQEKKK